MPCKWKIGKFPLVFLVKFSIPFRAKENFPIQRRKKMKKKKNTQLKNWDFLEIFPSISFSFSFSKKTYIWNEITSSFLARIDFKMMETLCNRKTTIMRSWIKLWHQSRTNPILNSYSNLLYAPHPRPHHTNIMFFYFLHLNCFS